MREDNFDNPLGESTGAAVISESLVECSAALRTAYEWATGKELKNVDFTSVRGLEGIKEATIDIEGQKVSVAVSSGLGNARKLLEKIQRGECRYHMIEIMACPGGCINGGGQPFIHADTDILQQRMKGIYSIDQEKEIRKSHENHYIQRLPVNFWVIREVKSPTDFFTPNITENNSFALRFRERIGCLTGPFLLRHYSPDSYTFLLNSSIVPDQ